MARKKKSSKKKHKSSAYGRCVSRGAKAILGKKKALTKKDVQKALFKSMSECGANLSKATKKKFGIK